MNSTEWHNLTDFVVYLGKSGKCHIDQTEKALYGVRSIHNDEKRLQQILREEAERAREKQQSLEASRSHPAELLHTSDDEKVIFSLTAKKSNVETYSIFNIKTKREMKSELE
ncbi:hypothetical protein X798_07755 [Onchocerca flexuosa]|uniref:DNA/RNA-binding protein Kin17 WH-like domain-containing protein n=1 Tax=Onchocerca flexuosa TaxID=387005 RepID=A0A238BIM7_9BILA|nr:hypothetical protein X798_07755 [Onchocerca flexuosa]